MNVEILAILLLHLTSVDGGKLSYYWPGDGSNAGELACGGSFTPDMEHVAYRGWRRVGCGRLVLVCAEHSVSCAVSRVRDAGPFGIARGRSRRVHTRARPPAGWRWRAAADLSLALWQRLERPSAFTHVYLVFLPEGLGSWLRRAEGILQRWLNPLVALARLDLV